MRWIKRKNSSLLDGIGPPLSELAFLALSLILYSRYSFSVRNSVANYDQFIMGTAR